MKKRKKITKWKRNSTFFLTDSVDKNNLSFYIIDFLKSTIYLSNTGKVIRNMFCNKVTVKIFVYDVCPRWTACTLHDVFNTNGFFMAFSIHEFFVYYKGKSYHTKYIHPMHFINRKVLL